MARVFTVLFISLVSLKPRPKPDIQNIDFNVVNDSLIVT